jgi:hypothetical protein
MPKKKRNGNHTIVATERIERIVWEVPTKEWEQFKDGLSPLWKLVHRENWSKDTIRVTYEREIDVTFYGTDHKDKKEKP